MLVLFIGHRRCGKTTLANLLRDRYNFVKYSFATPLKEACKEIFLFDDSQVYGSLKDKIDERYGVTPRRILQVFGTELFQYDIHKHIPELDIPERRIWSERFKLWYLKHSHKNVVIDDGRFQHEAEVVRDLGGKIIRIFNYKCDGRDETHPSEKEVDKIDYDYQLFSLPDTVPYNVFRTNLLKQFLSLGFIDEKYKIKIEREFTTDIDYSRCVSESFEIEDFEEDQES